MKKNNYHSYLKSYKWKYKRKGKLRFQRRCEFCGTTKNLQIHHKNYNNIFQERNSDLKVLCKRCHKEVHNK